MCQQILARSVTNTVLPGSKASQFIIQVGADHSTFDNVRAVYKDVTFVISRVVGNGTFAKGVHLFRKANSCDYAWVLRTILKNDKAPTLKKVHFSHA